MEEFMQQVVNGISLGSIYALVALGYTMVYGIIKLINFAHGDIYMIGAYVGYFAARRGGLSFFPALVLAMLACAGLGMIIEKIAYKPLRGASRITVLITAIGVSLLLENVMAYFFTPQVRAYPDLLPSKLIHIGGVVIKQQQIYIVLTAVALMLFLQFIVRRTKVGKAMRAVSIDRDAAELMGIKVDRTISYTFAIGSALAGAAGVLVGIYYNSINPLMGMLPGLKAFIAAVLGGIGIIPGAMLGGLSIGVIETMVAGYWTSLLKDAVVFGILIVFLIFKPSGILGKNTREKV